MKNKIIPYNPKLKEYARQLRKNSTLSEVLLWQKIKQRGLGVQFHRQVPLLDFIVDFYCHEIQLAIEIDGNSHDYTYEFDVRREGLLEKQGVRFIRFTDEDIKNNMFSVELSLKEKVHELLEINPLKNPPLTPPSKGESVQESSSKTRPTPPHPALGGNSFSKKEKLKSRKLIEKLFIEGKSISKYPIKLIYLQSALPEDVKIQAGVAVPKKNFKSAVKRNRIKRLLREAYRLNKHSLFNNSNPSFALLFLYIGREMPLYQDVEAGVKKLLQKFIESQDYESP